MSISLIIVAASRIAQRNIKEKQNNRENQMISKVGRADHFLMLNKTDEFNKALKEAIDMIN